MFRKIIFINITLVTSKFNSNWRNSILNLPTKRTSYSRSIDSVFDIFQIPDRINVARKWFSDFLPLSILQFLTRRERRRRETRAAGMRERNGSETSSRLSGEIPRTSEKRELGGFLPPTLIPWAAQKFRLRHLEYSAVEINGRKTLKLNPLTHSYGPISAMQLRSVTSENVIWTLVSKGLFGSKSYVPEKGPRINRIRSKTLSR